METNRYHNCEVISDVHDFDKSKDKGIGSYWPLRIEPGDSLSLQCLVAPAEVVKGFLSIHVSGFKSL